MNLQSLLLAGALVVSQDGFRYADAKKNLAVEANGGRGEQLPTKGFNLQLKGNVSIVSKSQGLTLKADTVHCETVTDPHERTELRHATANGSVSLVKEVTTAGAKQATDIKASAGDLDVLASGDVVKLSGPVRIQSIDAARKQTMVATGSSGTVTLEPSNHSAAGNGLRDGSLRGPVRVELDRAPQKGDSGISHIVATGDQMDFHNGGEKPTVRMSGHVEIHDPATGDITNVSHATLTLNQTGQVVGFEVAK